MNRSRTASSPFLFPRRLFEVILLACLLVIPGCLCRRSDSESARLFGAGQCASFPLLGGGWSRFRQPTLEEAEPRLILLQPHQAGKIPVVLIHGLFSDPVTWNPLLEGLLADPDIAGRFEFWAFRYPTGKSFLEMAASLRQHLRDKVREFDPKGEDSALTQMVLVGHSMGGLLAKLQVAHSDSKLWDVVSEQPLESLELESDIRETVRNVFFFEPLPFVRRVVFVATPHRGSEWATRPVGRLGRSMVHFPDRLQQRFERIVRDNRDKLNPSQSERLPTSIDRLSPSDPLLQATTNLRVAEGISLHSIIGTGYHSPSRQPGDGVVSIDSARLAGVASEHLVESSHTSIHTTKQTLEILGKILSTHAPVRPRQEHSGQSFHKMGEESSPQHPRPTHEHLQPILRQVRRRRQSGNGSSRPGRPRRRAHRPSGAACRTARHRRRRTCPVAPQPPLRDSRGPL